MAEGHSFTPSHGSLVDRYLRSRIDAGNIVSDLFHDADVCSARPHDLVREYTPARVPCRDAADGVQWFFFSPARFDGKSATRRSRAVDGTNEKESWHSEGSSKAVKGSSHGGFVQMFSYHVRTATGKVEKPGWIMAEYTFKGTRPGDVVLCKVYRSPRSKACLSPGTSSANSGTKRKAADDAEHLVAATPSTRPRLDVADQDDVMMFAEDIERNLMAHDDHDDTAPDQFGETMQNLVESPHPEPQVAPEASVMTLQEMETFLMTDEEDDGTTLQVPDGEDPEAFYWRLMTLQEMETLLMADEEDDGTTLQVPDGEDPEAFYLRVMGLYGADDQQQDAAIQQQQGEDATIQQQDADIQTARGLLSEYDVITALATGVTVDELLLIDGPSISCLHPGGALAVLCG